MRINNINIYNQQVSFMGKKSPAVIKKLQKVSDDISTRLINEEKKLLDIDKIILEKLLMGYQVHEIAETLGVTLYKVTEISAKYNAHKIYMQNRNNIILEQLKNGVPRKTIMKEMGVSKGTVQKVAEGKNAFQKRIKERDLLIVEKLKAGQQGKEIAKELNIDEATVWRAAKKQGFSLREYKRQNKSS